MASDYPIQRIPEAKLRKIFNDNLFWERAQIGEFIQITLEDRFAPVESAQPPGTRSQSISYRTEDNFELARVHQYVLENGQIGASGRPDPKRILFGGILFRLPKNPKPPEADLEPS